MTTLIQLVVRLVRAIWGSEPRRVVLPSIWETLSSCSSTNIDFKIRGMFVAEVVCEWRGAFFSGGMRPARVYLLDFADDILRLLNRTAEPEPAYNCILGKEITLVRLKQIDFTDQAPDLG